MRVSANQFRPFYPQKSLNFNFLVSDYSSNNFEVGISGTDYIHFKFKDGIIKDSSSNIIGTFNGEPLEIKGNLRSGRYNYYLNSFPIAKDLIVTNESSVFSAIVAKILDNITGSIDLQSYIEGDTIPTLEFSNFYSDNIATSGTISSSTAKYPIDIFSIKSNSITGSFVHNYLLNPGSSLDFFNYDIKNLDPGSIVQLNIESNFGNSSYQLQTRIVGDTTPPDDPDDPVSDILNNFYSNISLYSGEITKTGGLSTGLYQIEYSLPLASTSNSSLNLLFDYQAGRTGDTEIQISRTENIYYSGFLDLVNGVGSGILSNNDFSLTIEDYELDSNNKKDITFLPQSVVTGYFENLYGTGEITYTATVDDDTSFKAIINDQNLNSNYIIDLGGKTSTFPVNPNSQNVEYNKLKTYKFLDLKDTIDSYILKKEIKKEDKGLINLANEIIPFTGNTISNQIDYQNAFIDSSISIEGKEFYPYRGVGFAVLENQTLILSGNKNGSITPLLFLDGNSNTIFFKNLPTIDSNGKYTIGTNQAESNLIKGRILLNENVTYSKTGLYFETPSLYNLNGDQFVRRIVQDSLDSYKRLRPFDSIENANSSLFKKDGRIETKLTPDINWDENNFIISKPISNSNGLSYFYSNNENLTFGLILGNRFFTNKIAFGTFTEPLVKGQPSLRNAYTLKENYEGKNLLHQIYINQFLSTYLTPEIPSDPITVSTNTGFTFTLYPYQDNISNRYFKFGKYITRFTENLFNTNTKFGPNRDYRLEFSFHREIDKTYMLSFWMKIPDATGKVSAISGSNTLQGKGTLFLTQFKTGDTITVYGQTVQISSIASNTSLNIQGTFSTTFPDTVFSLAGSSYLNYLLQVIEDPDIPTKVILQGNVSSANSNSVSCSIDNIINNQYSNHVIRIISGTGTGQDRLISSNTETTFTISPNWNINPDITSQFQIVEKINWANFKIFPSISKVYGSAEVDLTTTITGTSGSNIKLVKMLIPPRENSKRLFNSRIILRLIGNATWNRNISILTANGTGSIATITFAAQSKAIPIGSAIVVTNVGASGYNGSFIVTGSTTSSVSYANSTSTSSTGGSLYQSDVDYRSPIYENASDFFYDTIERSFDIYGAQIEDVSNYNLSINNIPVSEYLPVTTEQLITGLNITNITDKLLFTFFIFKLHNIEGQFSLNNGLKFQALNPDDVKKYTYIELDANGIINKYKGRSIDLNLNIYKFFIDKIKLVLVNSPFLYTNFNTLYIENIDNITTFEKNNETYAEAVTEIIQLFLNNKPFSYRNNMPIGGGNTQYTIIPNKDLDTICFSGYLQNPTDLHVQAGYGRYYPYEENGNRSELFGYFCETERFFTIKNSFIVSDNQSVFDTFFPELKQQINRRPSTKISDPNPKLTRIIKNDDTLNFNKNINQSIYLNNCFFKELKTTTLDLFGVFYEAKKNISDVWKIEIKNSPDDSQNIYTSPVKALITRKDYNPKNIGQSKTNEMNNVYLKVIHKENEIFNFAEEDSVKITLSISSENQLKNTSSLFI
jgi:hypothetical protein